MIQNILSLTAIGENLLESFRDRVNKRIASFKRKQAKILEEIKRNNLIKGAIINAFFISIMHLLIYVGMLFIGIPPAFVDLFTIKVIIFTIFTALGIFIRKILFKNKKEILEGMLNTMIVSSVYQISGFLYF